MPKKKSPKKRITGRQLLGQKGVNLIEKAVLDMGFTWTPTGALEAGIDGYIELRDNSSGDMSNCIIQVQSKATDGAFQSESANGLSYTCKTADVVYWTSGNAPVILVHSRPSTNEAYWMDVKRYFAEHPDSKTVRFSKSDDRFDDSSAERLLALGESEDSGLYLPPPPKTEPLSLSMVRVTFRKKFVWSAPALHSTAKEAVDALKSAQVHVPRGWVIQGGRLYAWDVLHEGNWGTIVDRTDVKSHPVAELARTSEAALAQMFRRLLYRSLPSCLFPKIRHRVVDGKHLHYFGPLVHGQPRTYEYRGPKRRATQTVVRVEMKRDQPDEVYYLRCHAAHFRFRELGGTWFLDITPTYFFTTDGSVEHPDSKWLATRIKRLEGQRAILGQLRLWVALLRQEADMLNQIDQVFGFSELLTFDSELGFDESIWRLEGDTDDSISEMVVPEDGEQPDGDEVLQMGLFGESS